jgi:hypothetical protein
MAYHMTFVCFYGYQKMLSYGTFLSKCSQPFIDLIDVITSKEPVFLYHFQKYAQIKMLHLKYP